jgi:hypothetical protein
MTRAVIKSVVEEFLDSKKPEVLAISGKWGVGKTYALQEMVRAYEGGNSLAWYSYISAFGAKSIGDLRSMILVKTRPFPVKKGRVGDAVEEAEALFAKGRGGAIYKAAMAFLEKVPYGGKQVTVLLETVATSLIRRTVVCIDDIERLGSGITMDELMGLVSELKVESQCKVILLFNEEQLGERAKQYEQASEKVVDKKLAFMTTASEAVDFGLPSDTPLRECVIPCVEKLGISNIRTVQKIANGLQTVHRVIPNCSDAVNQQAAIAVAVFAGALYEGGIGFDQFLPLIRLSEKKLRNIGRQSMALLFLYTQAGWMDSWLIYPRRAGWRHEIGERWPHPFGQSSEIFRCNVRGSHAANLIAGSVAKYASSGVRSSRLE